MAHPTDTVPPKIFRAHGARFRRILSSLSLLMCMHDWWCCCAENSLQLLLQRNRLTGNVPISLSSLPVTVRSRPSSQTKAYFLLVLGVLALSLSRTPKQLGFSLIIDCDIAALLWICFWILGHATDIVCIGCTLSCLKYSGPDIHSSTVCQPKLANS